MKNFLLAFCFIFFTGKLFAQQFSQYNTGTLYDSFENPSQRAFIPDSSKQFASNFLVPNFNANFFLSGNAQATLKDRAFLYKYDNSTLQIGKGKYNMANTNANVYFLMLKMFTSLNGDQEMGFSAQAKVEGRGLFSDETIAALNGAQSFANGTYNNIFNSNYYYQSYDQISFTYREKLSKQFSMGFKLSGLIGVEYQKLTITGSNANYDKVADTVGVGLKGRYYAGFTPGGVSTRDFLPTMKNPGASITLGTTYKSVDGYVVQANIKDLGFIHWSNQSNIYNFDNRAIVQGLSKPAREDSIYNKVYDIIHSNNTTGSFTTPTDGRFELSVNKSFWVDEDHLFKYSPTVVASKELFYTGFVGGLVNPIQYDKYIFTLTATYDDLKTFNLGTQFMVKTSNLEVYLGSDKLTASTSLLSDQLSKNAATVTKASAYTGASFFLGFALKFGPVIEHPMNASSIPTGEKGFFGRLWNRFFKTYN